jgi:hypothetical protein
MNNSTEGTDMETVTIPKKVYERLKEDSRVLAALEAAGVDNWEGYSYAFEDEDDEEEDDE